MANNSELTAALATIEKCREIVGCPAGVDLQHHLRQLAAENVWLKQYALNCVNAVEHWNSWADKEDQITNDIEAPATDSLYAGVKADGVEEWVSSRGGRWNGTTEEALKFAKRLREGHTNDQ